MKRRAAFGGISLAVCAGILEKEERLAKQDVTRKETS